MIAALRQAGFLAAPLLLAATVGAAEPSSFEGYGALDASVFGTATIYDLLATSFLLLVIGTAYVVYREVRSHRPSSQPIVALVLVSGVALLLRLTISPRTFLHEFFHIAETISGYLTNDIGPNYGKTGPALIRFAAALFGRHDDVEIIFLTNAVIASLAIPALALLDFELFRSWPRALCAAALLCVMPQHLRFSAAEDIFVQAITFGLWALALLALYARTRSVGDALLTALALSLAMQARPEMLFFPGVAVAMLLLVRPSSWPILFAPRTLLALCVLAILLMPRLMELRQALGSGNAPSPFGFRLDGYIDNLVFFHGAITPRVYVALFLVGAAWSALRKPGLLAWAMLVFLGYTVFAFTMFDNRPWHVRSQTLPDVFLLLIAVGAASVWMELFGDRRRAIATGAAALIATGVIVVIGWRGFVTELRDQQLEWAFLERTVPRLPQRMTLLATTQGDGRNLDMFPDFLLHRDGKRYEMIDVRQAARGEVAWPEAGDNLLYYHGMFCYFALIDEPPAEPMLAACQAVHDRYVLEPHILETLNAPGYSWLQYTGGGRGPFQIGFYRVTGLRSRANGS